MAEGEDDAAGENRAATVKGPKKMKRGNWEGMEDREGREQ